MRWRYGPHAAMLFLLLSASALARDIPVVPGQSLTDKARLLQPGDRLILRAGVHQGSLTLSGVVGTARAPIFIHGEPGSQIRPTERDGILLWPQPCQYLVIEGLKIEGAARAGIIISNSRHIVVRNCALGDNGVWGLQTTMSDFITVEDCELYGSKREHGVYFSTTDHPVARNNRIHDNAGCGIHNNGDKSEGGDGMITGGLYENNVIFNNGRRGGSAVNLDGVEQSVVRGNLIFNNLAGGIVSFHHNGARTGSENQFLDNTIYFAPGRGRFGLQISGGGRDNVIRKNIVVCGLGPALELDRASTAGLQSGPNLLWRVGSSEPVVLEGRGLGLAQWRQQSLGQDAQSVSADPEFVDLGRANFRLRPGSPAKGMGATFNSAGSDATLRKRTNGSVPGTHVRE